MLVLPLSFQYGLKMKLKKQKHLWKKAEDLILEEVRSKTIKVDTTRVSGINNYPAGYLDKEMN